MVSNCTNILYHILYTHMVSFQRVTAVSAGCHCNAATDIYNITEYLSSKADSLQLTMKNGTARFPPVGSKGKMLQYFGSISFVKGNLFVRRVGAGCVVNKKWAVKSRN